MATGRYKPEGEAARSFGDQVEQFCTERGIMKQELADRAEISPAQLSHYIKFGTSSRMMERIAKAAGVAPDYFDQYVAEEAPTLVRHHRELLDFMRALRAASESKKRSLLRKLT